MNQKTLYCITSGLPGVAKNTNLALLRSACTKLGYLFKELPVPMDGFRFEDVPKVSPGGAYRLNVQSSCVLYEHALLAKNPHLTSIRTIDALIGPWAELINDEANGLSTIPALYCPGLRSVDSVIATINRYLDGFPVIVKKSGGSHGSGIIIIDSEVSFRTAYAHLNGGNSSSLALKKFIPNARQFRLVVLGNQTLCCTEYLLPDNDVRSNATDEPVIKVIEADTALSELAVAAVKQKKVIFGGVDIVEDPMGTRYIAEVNTPCNFARSEECTSVPVSEKIVSFLMS